MSIATWIEQAIAQMEAGSIIVTDLTQANLRFANNGLTTNGQMHSVSATVTAPAGDDDAVASGPVNSLDDLLELVSQVTTPAQHREPTAPPTDFAEPATPTTIDVFARLASGLGDAFADAERRDRALFGFAEHQLRTIWLATTDGARRRAVVPMGRLELNAKSADFTNSAWVGRASNDFTDVDINAIVAEAHQRLDWGETSIELPAGRYEVVLPPGAVADLLLYAYWTMNGRDAREGRNVFAAGKGATRVGERLASLPISLWSDPATASMPCPDFAVTKQNVPGMVSVRDNGEPVGRVDWMVDGELRTLVEPRTPEHAELIFPTENLLCDAGSTTSIEEMIASTTQGLLFTCLWYIREVDPETLLLTGLTRDGVYLIEDGQITGQVNNFRFNESPVDLLRRATQASASEDVLCREWNDYFTKTHMPALRIPDFNCSTVSKAR